MSYTYNKVCPTLTPLPSNGCVIHGILIILVVLGIQYRGAIIGDMLSTLTLSSARTRRRCLAGGSTYGTSDTY